MIGQNDLSSVEGMDRSVREARAEATRWAYADGLADFAVGAVFLAVAALSAVEARVPEGSPLDGLAALGLPVVILSALGLGRVVTPLWRQRVTYRRTGYAVLRQPRRGRDRLLALITAGVVAAAGALVLATRPAALAWMPLLQGVAVGGLLALIGWQGGARRFLGLALLAVALGSVLTLRSMSENVADVWFYGCLGLAAVVSGVLTLRAYLGQPLAGEA